jgi:hypothetical protein
MEPATRTAKTNDKPTLTAYIPYTQTTYGCLSRMLAKHNIKSVALPPRKIFSYFSPVKNAVGLKHRVYTALHVNVAGFILDKAVDLSNSESKNTIDI